TPSGISLRCDLGGGVTSFKDDDDEEEEHLAPADYIAIASPAVDLVPSAEETEPFETDEFVATPPPPPAYYTTSRMFVRSHAPIPFPFEAEVSRLLALHTPPPSPLTPLSSPLPQIPSPPLPVPSPPTTNLTYAKAPLGYKATGIYRRADIPEADIPPQKRLLLTAPTPRFEVGESFAAARQSGSTVARKDAQRDHAALCDEALDRSKAHNKALEARIVVLEMQVYRHEWQRQDADDHATRAIMCIQALEAGA
nr:hypothetical protein [Tanacetum cinerariifolium]